MYVKIIGNDEQYNETFEPFTTQHGYQAVRFTGDEIPETDKGFKVYNDNDKEIYDLSKYKYIYRQNEYSVEQDEIEQPIGNNESISVPSSSYGALDRRIDYIASQVADITPYKASKTAYIDDTSVEFDIAKDGNISVYMVDGEGQNVPFTFEQNNGKVIVAFEKRDSLAEATMVIQ